MRKIILKMADRHNENNQELMDVRRCFLEKIEKLGGLDNCRENPDLIQELEEVERTYDEKHSDSIIERFLYNGTVHWTVEKYDEELCEVQVLKLLDGSEKLFKKYFGKNEVS